MRDAAVKVSCGRAIVFALVCLSVTARAGEPQVRSSDGQLRPIRIPSRVLDPATWPVVPIPNISVDPTNGATVGIIPTRLQHGRGGEIDRIIAPDIIHNAHFGWGGHLRVLNFPSPDTQWSIVAGVKQRIDLAFRPGQFRQRTLAHAFAQIINQFVLQNTNKPGALVRAAGESLPRLQRGNQRFLDQVLGLREVAQAEVCIAI